MLTAGVDHQDLAKRGESLIRQSSNRYLTTVKIAFRAKQRRFDDFDGLLEESSVKPVQRAIVELSDEQDQPDLLPGGFSRRVPAGDCSGTRNALCSPFSSEGNTGLLNLVRVRPARCLHLLKS